MAKENDDDTISVQLDDEETVSVSLDDDQTTVAPTEKVVQKEPKRTRVRVAPVETQVAGPSPEEALAQAQAYSKQQEDARRAAEATAASERSMREQAQRETLQAQQDAQQYQERATNSELIVIENGIVSAQKELEAYETEYTRAAEAGEFAKMGSIQTKLSRAAAKLDRLESEKVSFERSTPSQRQQTTEGRVTETTVTPNVSERYLSQFSPVAQNWLRQHPECWPADVGGSAQKNSKMMAGHYDAMAQNLTLNSPEYFKVIEEHVNPPVIQQPQIAPTVHTQVASKAAEIQQAGETRPAPRAVQPSAPVSRDAPNSGGPRSLREVRLTKEQAEFAKMSFPHLSEAEALGRYARNLVELEAEGKIGRLTH